MSIVDDTIVEGPETITISGSAVATGYTGLGDAAAELTIYDDDADIVLSVSPESVEEQATAQQITVTASFKGMSSILTAPTAVTVTVTGAGGAMLGTTCPSTGVDACTGLANDQLTVNIPAGDLSGTGTFNLTAPDDSTDETGEKLELTGSASLRDMAVDVEAAEILIHDAGPSLMLSLHEATTGEAALERLVEDGAAQTVRVKATASEKVTGTEPVTVSVTIGASGSTATAASCSGSGLLRTCTGGGDYDRGDSGTVDVAIAVGDRVGHADVSLRALTDSSVEGEETIRFDATVAGYRVVPAELKIRDRISLTLSEATIAEGSTNAGGVTVTAAFVGESGLSSNLGSATDVDLAFAAAAGTEAADFTAPGTAVTLSIPAGSTSSMATALTGLLINPDMVAEDSEAISITGSAIGFEVLGASLSIVDDDLGVTVEVEDTDSVEAGVQKSVGEESASPNVRVRAKFTTATSNDLGAAYRVEITAAEASPASATGGGTDFTAPGSAASVSIPTGMTSLNSPWATLSGLGITDDAVVEGPETFAITGTVTTGATVTGDTVTIDDDDADVSLTAHPAAVAEQTDAHRIEVTARFAGSSSALSTATDVTVDVGPGDTDPVTVASTGYLNASCSSINEDVCTDQTNNQFTISIPAGQTSHTGTFQLTARNDMDNSEDTENVKISGSTSLGDVGSAQVEVYDPDLALALTFHEAASADPVLESIAEEEGAQTVRVKATLGSAVSSSTTITVNVGADGGTAVRGAGEDYTRSTATATITLASNESSGTADVVITPRADDVVEGAETIRFTASAAGYLPASADLPIREAIQLSLNQSSVAETDENAGAGAIEVSASFPGAASSDLTVPTNISLGFTLGQGLETEDATAPGSTVTVVIPAGATVSSTAQALSGLMITGDEIAEDPEVLNIGGTAAGFWVSPVGLTIADDDRDVTLEADTDSVMTGEQKTLTEGSTPAVRVRAKFTDADTNDLSSALAVEVTAAASSPASAAGGGTDFTAPGTPVTVTIPTGTASLQGSWANLTGLAVADDTVTEPAETFLITGTSPTAGVTVTPDTLTIGASDTELEISAAPANVAERTNPYTVTVTAGFANATSSELTSNTAVTVSVAAGDTSPAMVASSCGVINMNNNDVCTDKTSNSFSISIPAGQAENTGTFQLTARDDMDDTESVETVKITGSATVAGAAKTASDTINVVNSGIELALTNAADGSALPTTWGEGSGATTVRVTAALPSGVSVPAGGVVVGLRLAGAAVRSADAVWSDGEDYRASNMPAAPAGTPAGYATGISIAAGSTSGTADITLVVNDDNWNDGAETIVFEGSEVTIGSVDYHTVAASLTISDNDAAPTSIDLQILDADGDDLSQVAESDGDVGVRLKASFRGTVTRTGPTSIPITVGTTGEAASGTDYQIGAVANVVIPAYQLSGTTADAVTLTVEDDDTAEGGEAVTFSGTHAPFTIASDTLTILDNDLTLAFLDSSNQPLTEIAEGTAGNINISLQGKFSGNQTLAASTTIDITVGGTAEGGGTDYRFTTDPPDIVLSSGINNSSNALILTVNDDNIDEPNETIQVSGTAAGFTIAPATLTITDNDDPPTSIEISLTSETAAEGSTAAVNTRFAAGSNPRSVDTAVVYQLGGAAALGAVQDYIVSPANLTAVIPAGATEGNQLTVTVNNDTQTEGAETITFRPRPLHGYTFNQPSLTLTIPANDQQPTTSPPPTSGGTPPPPAGGGGGGGGAPPPAAPPPAAPPPTEPPPAAPEEAACQGRFCDEDGSVHQANIERIAEWQITLGCDADDPTLFCPRAQITRRQMAAFLYRAVSQRWSIQTPEDVEISDVPADAWYRTFADWVVSINAFTLDDEGNFNPGGVVTRADMAIMLIAAFPHLNAVENPPGRFQDAQNVPPAVAEALEGMYQTGVTRGCTTEPLRYCPNQPVTRAQMASFFVRAVTYTPSNDGDDS